VSETVNKEWVWERDEVKISHTPAIIEIVEIPEAGEMEWWR
jgi:hypothetical protein